MIYLGVDGGGTKTAFELINSSGSILAYNIEGSSDYLQVGVNKLKERLSVGLNKACHTAGIKKKDIKYSFWGLPCYGEQEEAADLLERIVFELIGERFECGNDVEAAWAGSLACKPGINIVGGTGAIGYGKDQTGNTARASGWGDFFGDEGSAYWLGKEALSLFTKESDGRIDKSILYYIFKDEFNLKEDFNLISIVYDDLKMKRDKIAKLALLLYKAATLGDENAINIFNRAACEFSLIIKAIRKKLNFENQIEVPASYSGGVFKAGPYILNPLKKHLKDYNILLRKPALRPVTGSALYALIIDGSLKEYDDIVEKLKMEEKGSL